MVKVEIGRMFGAEENKFWQKMIELSKLTE